MKRDNDSNTREQTHFQSDQPDAFDRAYGQAQGFPHTRESTITSANVLGVGGVRQYIVQTFRVPEVGDMVFISIAGAGGLTRVYLPAKITNVIASQRDALTTQSRRRSGRARAQADKEAGKVPGFMRKRGVK